MEVSDIALPLTALQRAASDEVDDELNGAAQTPGSCVPLHVVLHQKDCSACGA